MDRYFNFLVFILLLSGIFAGNLIPSYSFFSFFFILAFCLVCLSVKTRKILYIPSISFLIVCLGALLFISSGSVDKDNFLEGKPEFKIKVTSLLRQNPTRNTFSALILEAGGYRQNFKVRVFDYSKKLTYLNKYNLNANLSKRAYRGRIFYNLWIAKDTQIKEIPLSFWERSIQKVNHYCLGVFRDNCGQAAKNFLAAVFLGRRELLGEEQVFMRKAGLAHLLAISGLHIGLISLILFYFLRFFGLNFKTSLLVSSFFLIFYAAATGMRASVQRAALMYLIFVFGFLIKRKQDVLNSLGLAGVILLLFAPSLAFDLGFQLSFLAVFGIIAGFKVFPYRSHRNFFINSIKQLFLSSFFVFVFIFPLISYHFSRIHLFGPFYNLILIPFFTLILFLNFFLIILSPFAFLAQGLGQVLSWLIFLFQRSTVFLGSLPISYFSYSFTLGGALVYYFFLFVVLTIFSLTRWKRM